MFVVYPYILDFHNSEEKTNINQKGYISKSVLIS